MASTWKGVPIPTLVGLLLFIIGGILHIIGIATPHWHDETRKTSMQQIGSHANFGLWVDCSTVAFDAVDCKANESKSYIVATRALEILALLLGAICILVCGIWYFLQIQKFRLILMITTLSTGFLSGLFGIIGIIVYGIEINTADPSVAGILVTWTLGWSFALCCISSIFAFIATALLVLGTRIAR